MDVLLRRPGCLGLAETPCFATPPHDGCALSGARADCALVVTLDPRIGAGLRSLIPGTPISDIRPESPVPMRSGPDGGDQLTLYTVRADNEIVHLRRPFRLRSSVWATMTPGRLYPTPLTMIP